jgi:antitoxin (DNA-binding transcriptional repressor) of toxin-antitoxin stability system
MVKAVSKSQFKARALEYFREVEASGETIIITDRGEPRLELRPHQPPGRGALAELQGSVLHYEGPFDPVGLEDWEVLP